MRFLKKIFANIFISERYNENKYYSKYYYRQYVEKFKDLDTLIRMYERVSRLEKVVTPKNIKFSDKLNFGTGIDSFKKTMLKPTHSISSEGDRNYDVLLYKTNIDRHKVKLILHFYEGKLFYYSYIFQNLKKEDESEILEVLRNKYVANFEGELTKVRIVDPNRSTIYVENDFDLSVNYLAYQSGFHDYAKSVIQQKIVAAEIKKEKEKEMLIDRL